MGCGCGKKRPSVYRRAGESKEAKEARLKAKAAGRKKSVTKSSNGRAGKLTSLVKASKKPRKSRKSK
jgi:hypothetical protein